MEKGKEIKTTEIYDLAKPSQMIQLAGEIQKYIKEKGLAVTIQKREYCQVEGWQFAGFNLGILPIVTEVENLSSYVQKNKQIPVYEWKGGRKVKTGEKSVSILDYKYKATCEIIDSQKDKVVGRGIMLCSNDERGKEEFDEYAIMSMAQTRSIGKAYRLLIGWLMKSAGFQTTPAEEMDGAFIQNDKTPEKDTSPKADKPIQKTTDGIEAGRIIAIKEKLSKLKTEPEVVSFAKDYPEDIRNTKVFKELINNKLKELKK